MGRVFKRQTGNNPVGVDYLEQAMNLKVNQNLLIVKAEDGVTDWYRDKWHQSASSLDKAKRQLTKLRQLITIERKRNEGGPDVVFMEQDDTQRMKEMDERHS